MKQVMLSSQKCNVTNQGWIKCGSGEHCSQEMTRKIEETVTLGYEEKKKREEEERKEEEKRRRKEKRGEKRRGRN